MTQSSTQLTLPNQEQDNEINGLALDGHYACLCDDTGSVYILQTNNDLSLSTTISRVHSNVCIKFMFSYMFRSVCQLVSVPITLTKVCCVEYITNLYSAQCRYRYVHDQ
jgi:hypothetical protein